jgi:hypothetical protein
LIECESKVRLVDIKRSQSSRRAGRVRLELLLIVLSLSLAFQLLPSIWLTLLSAADLRNWSPFAWIICNVGIVTFLLGIRFGPDLHQEWSERRRRIAEEREQRARLEALKEMRMRCDRLREAQKRRLY